MMSAPMNMAKRVNIALQGGGAHGAFTWGVLDQLLEDGRIDIEGICGTSAGALNATVLAYGHMRGGNDGAREALHSFWRAVSDISMVASSVRRLRWAMFPSVGWPMHDTLIFNWFETMTRLVSPYQFNPLNVNPLRQILERCVDFESLRRNGDIKLFVSTTNVRTGQLRVFHTHELTLDALMASACLPFVFQAVAVGGEHYWDGGYMGNPPLFPLFYHTDSRDVIVVHINPIVRDKLPTDASAIMNRINEISFNSSLLREFRAMAFVTRLIEEGWLKDEYKGRLKQIFVHSIRADQALTDASVASKFNLEWSFLTALRDRGRVTAAAWLEQHFASVNCRSTVDLRAEFLDRHTLFWENSHSAQPERRRAGRPNGDDWAPCDDGGALDSAHP
jgi:NTE family protein